MLHWFGAHAFPMEYKKKNHSAYIDLIINEMLPKIAENLADYIDAFLETGYFSVKKPLKIMEAGRKYGLEPKFVNQFTAIDGIKACVENGAFIC